MVWFQQGIAMDLTAQSATQLARLIREKKCSAREALEAHLTRVERYNPRVNAIVTMALDDARQRADQADNALAAGELWGPLHGVPITVKDTWDTADMRTTIGVPWLKKNTPGQDAPLVRRLREAGAIIWGKSNLPFASYDWQCNQSPFGKCHNPWRYDYTPGGSSSGAAAAVAACFTPLELGSDIAGSIRHPAHCCGVFGLRATEGLLDARGHGNVPGGVHSMRNLASYGPIARTVEDIRLAMQVLTDPLSAVGRMTQQAAPVKPLKEARIAWTERLGQVPICADTQRVLHATVAILQEAGADVQQLDEPFDTISGMKLWGALQGFELNPQYPWPVRFFPGSWLVRWLFFPWRFGNNRFSRSLGRGYTSSISDYFHALEQRDRLQQQTDVFFSEWDLWLTPVSATTAFQYRRSGQDVQVQGHPVPYGEVTGMYNCPSAAMGHPILTIPAGLSKDGLPIGLQLHGRRYGDFPLLTLAEEIAALLPGIGVPDLERTMVSEG